MNLRPLRLVVLLAASLSIAETRALALPPAPTVTFTPRSLILYSGDVAPVQARFIGYRPGTRVGLRSATDGVVVPAFLENGADSAATFDVTAMKPGDTAVEWVSHVGLRVGLWVRVLAPEVRSIAPARGWTSGGEEITIGGNGFSAGCMVWFGDIPARQLTLADRQTLVATTPVHAAGTSDIRVICGAHAEVAEAAFEFIAPRRRTVRH